MMFQRAPVAVYTCVRRTHVMLGGLRVSMARWDHQYIFSLCALQRYPSGLHLPPGLHLYLHLPYLHPPGLHLPLLPLYE